MSARIRKTFYKRCYLDIDYIRRFNSDVSGVHMHKFILLYFFSHLCKNFVASSTKKSLWNGEFHKRMRHRRPRWTALYSEDARRLKYYSRKFTIVDDFRNLGNIPSSARRRYSLFSGESTIPVPSLSTQFEARWYGSKHRANAYQFRLEKTETTCSSLIISVTVFPHDVTSFKIAEKEK